MTRLKDGSYFTLPCSFAFLTFAPHQPFSVETYDRSSPKTRLALVQTSEVFPRVVIVVEPSKKTSEVSPPTRSILLCLTPLTTQLMQVYYPATLRRTVQSFFIPLPSQFNIRDF